MKYKVRDSVRIKTWEQMEKEYGVVACENIAGDIIINCKIGITLREYHQFIKLCSDRIMTIKTIEKYGYVMNIERWFNNCWHEDMIECLVEEYKKPKPIENRLEILDL